MSKFDDELKAAMDVSKEEALTAFGTERNTKLTKRIKPAETIAGMWAPYIKFQGGYTDGTTLSEPDLYQKAFLRLTESAATPLIKSFAEHLKLMQKLMQNVHTAEIQLENLIKLNDTKGVLDNAKLFMQKEAVKNTIDANLKAMNKAHRDLLSERHKLAKKMVQASTSLPDNRTKFAVQYLIHQLTEVADRISEDKASFGMSSKEMIESGISKLEDFNDAPAANARTKLDSFVTQLGSMRLTQNDESYPAYLRTVQVTNELRKSFDTELKANAKALNALEKTFTKSVPKSKPHALTSKPTAFDVYLDTLSKTNKMIELLEKKKDLVKSVSEVTAVKAELQQWQDMRTQLKLVVQNSANDNTVVFLNEGRPAGTVLQKVKDMNGDFRSNPQINAMLKLLATQIDHPNYKTQDFPKLFAGEQNKNIPQNWNDLIEQPALAAQHLSDLQPKKPTVAKPVKSAEKTDRMEAAPTEAVPPASAPMPSLDEMIKDRDKRNQSTLQGTANNLRTCQNKLSELNVPNSFVNFVKDQFALHMQDLQSFLGDRNNLKNTKLIEAMNHRAELLKNITLVLEQSNVTKDIAINAVRGLAKTEFNRTPETDQTKVFRAELRTFVKSTESVPVPKGPLMGEKPPGLALPPTLPDAAPAPSTPRASIAGMFGTHSRPATPASTRSVSLDSETPSSRSDSSSTRFSSSSDSNSSTRSNDEQPPPPLTPPPGYKNK